MDGASIERRTEHSTLNKSTKEREEMFENMGFDAEDYRNMKEAIGTAVEKVKQFVELELSHQNGGI